MSKIQNPHDKFFKDSMSYQKVAKEFFEVHLPAEILKVVDLNHLEMQKESYIEELTDLVFKTTFLGKPGYLYLIFDYQSPPRELKTLVVLKAMFAIIDDHLKKTGEGILPAVYPMIFYAGDGDYNCSVKIPDLFWSNRVSHKVG